MCFLCEQEAGWAEGGEVWAVGRRGYLENWPVNRIHADPFEKNLFQVQTKPGPESFHWCRQGGGSWFVSG